MKDYYDNFFEEDFEGHSGDGYADGTIKPKPESEWFEDDSFNM